MKVLRIPLFRDSMHGTLRGTAKGNRVGTRCPSSLTRSLLLINPIAPVEQPKYAHPPI